MTWIRQKPLPPWAHGCEQPKRLRFIESDWACAQGSHGDLWRCDECQTLWVVEAGGLLGPTWSRAGRWLRWKYRKV